MGFSLICPVVLFIVMAGMLWLFISGWKLRALSRADAFQCGGCGHRLFEGQGACPECGTPWAGPQVAQLQAMRRRMGTVRVMIGIALGMAILLVLIATIIPLLNYVNATPPAPPPAPVGR